MIILKTLEQINIMNEANKIVHHILDFAEKKVEVGMSSEELDATMEKELSNFNGATPTFKGYMGYPKMSCISVNSEIVHAIPSKRKFNEGDIISIDLGITLNGFVGDAAKTFILGKPKSDKDISLIKETKRSLYNGIDKMIIGNRLSDIGEAIDKVAQENNFGNVRNFCGHGIGTRMHESPNVFNYVELREPDIRLQEGLVLALEPMFTLGTYKTKILKDKWTVVSRDKSNAAHWEMSVAVTKNGPKILG